MIASKQGGVRFELDWREYFRAFREAHGAWVTWRPTPDGQEWLLFEDGAMYLNGTRYDAPERPPPEDPLERRKLVRTHWLIRRAADRREYREKQEFLRSAREAARARSLPLKARVRWWDGDEGRVQSKVVDLCSADGEGGDDGPLGGVRARLAELEQDLARCDEVIAELSNPEGTVDVGDS